MRDEEACVVIVRASALDGRALHVCRPVAQQRYRHHSPRRETCQWRRIGPTGEARANAYVDYFRNFTLDSKPIHFDYLFAAKDSHESKRPKLTIKPLSKALGLHVNTDFKEEDYASLADELRSAPYSNKNILVCWHHGKIPELLASLGADPQKLLPPKGKWPKDVFGWFVRLEYDQNGNLSAKVQDEDAGRRCKSAATANGQSFTWEKFARNPVGC